MTITRKIAVITGASAGVGRETARVFARSGFDVALLARGDAGLKATAREVEGFGRRCLVIPTDVADFSQVEGAADRIEAELGPIDVWVNNAMATVFSPLADVKPDDFERAISVSFLGQVWGTMVALQRMQPRDEGAIINVGSALSFVGIPLQSAHCASKFACRGFFEAARAELLHDGSNVRLSMVHPPAMNTPQFDWCETSMENHSQPLPPIYHPEIAAQAIFDTAVDGKRSRIVGSWTKILVLMDSLFPGLGNHFASLGAWNAQLTRQPVAADRPSNLRAPADSDVDFGGRGGFSDRASGVEDPSFLITLPKMVFTYVRAIQLTAGETMSDRHRGERHAALAAARSDATHHVRSDQQGDRSGLSGQDVRATVSRRAHDPGAAVGTNNALTEQNSLDVLENEDRRLLDLFQGIAASLGDSVEERYEYGNLAKEILRHLAIRQSSLIDVGKVVSTVPDLRPIGSRMVERAIERRRAIVEANKMARGVQPVSLNEGQDFDVVFEHLIESVNAELEWELSSGIPAIRSALAQREESRLRSAHYVRHHAPPYLSDRGPRWIEQAPVVSRFLTWYGRMEDFPRASRTWRSS